MGWQLVCLTLEFLADFWQAEATIVNVYSWYERASYRELHHPEVDERVSIRTNRTPVRLLLWSGGQWLRNAERKLWALK